MKTRLIALIPLALALVVAWTRPVRTQNADGAALFRGACAGCHNTSGATRAPDPDALRGRSPESIVDALTGGAMRYQGLSLSGVERRAIAEYITGKKLGGDLAGVGGARCAVQKPLGDVDALPLWNGWGPTVENTHYQPTKQAGLTPEQIPHLTLKWAFGFPDTTSSWGQPAIAGGRLFVGGQNGTVYSLDAKTGCVYWTFTAQGGVRASLTIARRSGSGAGSVYGAYFSDQKGFAYALDAATGKVFWSKKVEDHPLIRLTGSPVLYENRLYVPTSSYEEVGKGADYACCTFRGGIVAFDAMTGAEIWKAFTIADPPKVMGRNKDGIDSIGPSGGAIWSAPTIDVKRHAIYVGAGNTYSGSQSDPGTDGVDAFDLRTGRVLWKKQLHENDRFGCRNSEPNCGDRQGPDFDIGMSPTIAHLAGGRDLVLVGQKSRIAWALDPDKQGEVVWKYQAGRGGALGGIEWGIALDNALAYLPVADANSPTPGGLHAVTLATGERAWFAAPPPLMCGRAGRGCSAAQSAAITVIPGAVFSGSFDGGIRAYSTKDGAILWAFDTNREFLTINGVPARGASLNGPAPVVAGGMLYVGSGDYRSRTGNVLLAFDIE